MSVIDDALARGIEDDRSGGDRKTNHTHTDTRGIRVSREVPGKLPTRNFFITRVISFILYKGHVALRQRSLLDPTDQRFDP